MSATASVTALIVEDEPFARRRLRELMRDAPWLHCLGEATNGRAAIAAIDELQPDLVFLDVQLPGCSGIDVLSRVRHTPAVIFTTAHDQFAVTAFELGAIDYLLKPFGRQRFQTMLERVRQRLSQQGAVPAAERAQVALGSPLRRLFARTRDGIVPIDVRSIQHLQASGDYVEVFCESGRYLLHTSLAELAQRLDPEVFCQVHRSHMVNLEAVELLRPYDARRLLVELRGGRKIVASRAASEQLRRLVR